MIYIILSGFLVFLAFALGASVASFLGVVHDRKGRNGTGESINNRSHCACGRQLKNTENIPVVGWLKTRGKASCCGATLPKWMLISEITLGFAFAAPVAMLLLRTMP